MLCASLKTYNALNQNNCANNYGHEIVCNKFIALYENRFIMQVFNVNNKMELIQDCWNPHVLAELNNHQIRLAKIQGEFVWHAHAHEDECFMVLKGSFDLHFRDQVVHLHAMDGIVVPKGVEHKPVAQDECWILLFEPATTINTGNVINDRTIFELKNI